MIKNPLQVLAGAKIIGQINTPDGKVYSNNHHIPLETAIFAIFMNSQYDGKKTSATNISVSDLLYPMRKLLYKINFPEQEDIVDVSTLVNSAKGTSHHASMEDALEWFGGYTQEVRSEVIIDGVTVSGKFDIITPDGEIKDLKHVSNYAMKLLLEEKEKMVGGLSLEEMSQAYPTYFKYQMQMSMYRYLNQDKISKPFGTIIFMLNNGGDFNKYEVDSEIRFPLYPPEMVHEYIVNKLTLLKQHLADGTYPECTPVDRGTRPPQYRLTRYSDATKKYRTVSGSKFDNEPDFVAFVEAKGRPGDVEEIEKAKHVLCGYCTYGINGTCTQR